VSSVVRFFLCPSTPPSLANSANPRASRSFSISLPESCRHQIDREVREVKKEETRLRRAQHAAEYLMEAMEAKLNLPPLIRMAFARNAKAHPPAVKRKNSPARAPVPLGPIPHGATPPPRELTVVFFGVALFPGGDNSWKSFARAADRHADSKINKLLSRCK